MIDIALVKERYARMSDEQLIHLLTTEGQEITKDAMAVLRQEFLNRNLDVSIFATVEENKNLQLTESIKQGIDKKTTALHNSIWSYVFAMKQEKRSNKDISKKLLEKGLNKEQSALVIESLEEKTKEAITTHDNAVLYGSLTCVAGLLITYLTYSFTSNGGTYIVAWGAILFGGIRFFRGLSNREKYQAILNDLLAEKETASATE